MDLNISELTKLEVNYNKLQKAHAVMKNQLDIQSAKLRVSLATAPTIDNMKKKNAKIAIKIAKITSRDSTIGILNANIVQLQ